MNKVQDLPRAMLNNSGLARHIEHDAYQRKHVSDGSGIESCGRAAADELREQLRSDGIQPEAAEGREKMLSGIALCRASRGLGQRMLRHVTVPGVRKERRRAGNGGVQLDRAFLLISAARRAFMPSLRQPHFTQRLTPATLMR